MATASLTTAQLLTLFYTVIGFGYSQSDHCPMINSISHSVGYSKSDHCPMINSISHYDCFWLQQVWPLPND
jgi:hypothetical protein